MQSEVHEAFRDRGDAEDKAAKPAAGLGKRGDDLTESVTDIGPDIAGVKGEQIAHRRMLGLVLAANVAIVLKPFSH